MTPDPDEDDMRAAALQYVRKISGFRAPAAHNREVFDAAVDAVAEATARLLDGLEIRGASAPAAPAGAAHTHTHSGAGTGHRPH